MSRSCTSTRAARPARSVSAFAARPSRWRASLSALAARSRASPRLVRSSLTSSAAASPARLPLARPAWSPGGSSAGLAKPPSWVSLATSSAVAHTLTCPSLPFRVWTRPALEARLYQLLIRSMWAPDLAVSSARLSHWPGPASSSGEPPTKPPARSGWATSGVPTREQLEDGVQQAELPGGDPEHPLQQVGLGGEVREIEPDLVPAGQGFHLLARETGLFEVQDRGRGHETLPACRAIAWSSSATAASVWAGP